VTQRALCLAALAEGESQLENPLLSDDTLFMVAGLKNIGFQVRKRELQESITLRGEKGSIPWDEGRVWAGAAGTVLRFLLAMLPLGKGVFTIDGEPRLRKRPIMELVEALNDLGADIVSMGSGGDFLPLEVKGKGGMKGGSITLSGKTSSQFLSALLMVGPKMDKGLEVHIEDRLASLPYVDLTLEAMQRFGVSVENEAYLRFRVKRGEYRGCRFPVEGDASAATYFLASGAVSSGRVRVKGVGRDSRQGDAGFLELLDRMGAETGVGPDWLEAAGPLTAGGTFDMNSLPDAVPTLAVASLFTPHPTEIRNVPNLRVKESDRIAAVSRELRKLGARVDEYEDGMKITPGPLTGGRIETYEDHRMAMAFAVAGLAAEGVIIENPGCVSKSFPGFFSKLEALVGREGRRET
ncbi:MAG: 3-phosphoshikimate 1-carboxyvinyltransferase, partial [Planctomycetota bacterium]